MNAKALTLFGLAASTMVLPSAFASAHALGNLNKTVSPAATVQDFETQDAQGKSFKMSEALSSGVVLLWFTNLCEGCQADMPEFEALAQSFPGKSVRFAAVSVLGPDRETARKVQSKTGFSFPILIDPDGLLSKLVVGSWAENACPLNNVFIVGKEGTIQYKGRFSGGLSRAEIETELRKASTSHQKRRGDTHVKP